jgi:alpha-beta hydrolase superfamily lysophospholipase
MSDTGHIPSPSGSWLAAAAVTATRPTPPRAPQLERDRITAEDGAVLPLRSWMPIGKPHAIVLALHGFNDYSNAFAGAGAAFAAKGVAVFAYDQRGFGGAPQRGRWVGSERLVDDALTATRLLRDRYPGLPLYLLGESMGGAIAILASTRAEHGESAPDGIILLAPAVWGRATMNVFERTGLWIADLFPHVRWSPSLIPMRILASDNLPMLRALGADPLVIKETRADTLNGLVDLMGEALAAAPRFHAPALLLYGEQDAIVPRPAMTRFVASLPPDEAARQRVAIYPKGYHLLSRDLDGPLVLSDMLAWIERQDAALPSGADRDARARLLRPPPSGTTSASGTRPSWQRAPS